VGAPPAAPQVATGGCPEPNPFPAPLARLLAVPWTAYTKNSTLA
jgi:hypothetical protein